MASKKKTRSRGTERKRKPRFKPTDDHARNYCQTAVDYAVKAADPKNRKRYCKWVRLAAKRFLKDLETAKKRGSAYTFDPWCGNDVCDFIEKLPHIEGVWETPTIKLEPPQIFILVNIFGFRDRKSGRRRFTKVYIEMARKGAKSTLTAGISLYCLTCEDEPGAQVIVAATTGDQAKKVFGPAWQMVKRTPDLREAFGLSAWGSQQYPRSITCDDNGGFIQPINAKSDTQDGWNPYMGVLDELHAHKTRGLYDVINSAFGARLGYLMWAITTAGYNTQGVCYEHHKLVKKILEGLVEADHYFGIIFTIDEGDDEFDEGAWVKANPMLGVTPTLESMRAYAKEALASPESLAEFKTKKLNVWTSARNAWLHTEDIKRWKKNLDLEALKPEPCYGGLDLSSTSDITAWGLNWEIDGRTKMYVRCYLPEDKVKDAERRDVPYQLWADQGWLTLTPGNVIDNAFIQADIEKALDEFNVLAWGYDPWNATDIVSRLLENGAPMVEVRQGPKSMHPAMKEFERINHNKKRLVDFNGNPILPWAASNLVARKGPNEDLSPDKKNSHEKIDPMIAQLIAIGLRLQKVNANKRSVYEDRGILEVEL